MMNAKPLLEKTLHDMTTKYSYRLGESISIGHGGDFANADFSTMPKLIAINGYKFELEGGIKGQFHTYRVVGLSSGEAGLLMSNEPLPFDELYPEQKRYSQAEIDEISRRSKAWNNFQDSGDKNALLKELQGGDV